MVRVRNIHTHITHTHTPTSIRIHTYKLLLPPRIRPVCTLDTGWVILFSFSTHTNGKNRENCDISRCARVCVCVYVRVWMNEIWFCRRILVFCAYSSRELIVFHFVKRNWDSLFLVILSSYNCVLFTSFIVHVNELVCACACFCCFKRKLIEYADG